MFFLIIFLRGFPASESFWEAHQLERMSDYQLQDRCCSAVAFACWHLSAGRICFLPLNDLFFFLNYSVILWQLERCRTFSKLSCSKTGHYIHIWWSFPISLELSYKNLSTYNNSRPSCATCSFKPLNYVSNLSLAYQQKSSHTFGNVLVLFLARDFLFHNVILQE